MIIAVTLICGAGVVVKHFQHKEKQLTEFCVEAITHGQADMMKCKVYRDALGEMNIRCSSTDDATVADFSFTVTGE